MSTSQGLFEGSSDPELEQHILDEMTENWKSHARIAVDLNTRRQNRNEQSIPAHVIQLELVRMGSAGFIERRGQQSEYRLKQPDYVVPAQSEVSVERVPGVPGPGVEVAQVSESNIDSSQAEVPKGRDVTFLSEMEHGDGENGTQKTVVVTELPSPIPLETPAPNPQAIGKLGLRRRIIAKEENEDFPSFCKLGEKRVMELPDEAVFRTSCVAEGILLCAQGMKESVLELNRQLGTLTRERDAARAKVTALEDEKELLETRLRGFGTGIPLPPIPPISQVSSENRPPAPPLPPVRANVERRSPRFKRLRRLLNVLILVGVVWVLFLVLQRMGFWNASSKVPTQEQKTSEPQKEETRDTDSGTKPKSAIQRGRDARLETRRILREIQD